MLCLRHEGNVDFLRKFKKIRNEIRKITRHIHKNEQIEVAKTAKTNPKKFWAYVKNKTSSSTIGDIKDKDIIIFEDDKKHLHFVDTFPVYLLSKLIPTWSLTWLIQIHRAQLLSSMNRILIKH